MVVSLVLIGMGQAGATTYTVSAGGSIQAGVNKLKAGDTLLINSGTYKEQVTIKSSGTAGKPIVIKAAPGAKPVINGTGKNFYEEGLIYLNGKNYITLQGIAVKNSPFYCIQVSDSDHIIVEKMLVDGCYHGGIIFDQDSSNVQAINNEVTGTDKCGQGCGTHEAITFSEVTNFIARGNYVHHGIKEGIDAKDSSKNGDIYNNVVAHMGQVGLYLNQCTNVKMHHNKVHDNGSSGIQVTVGDLAMGSNVTSNNQIYQNAVWNNAYCGLEFWCEGDGRMDKNSVYNNVFHNNKHYGIQLSDEDDQVYNNIIRNNIISNNKLGGITGVKDANTISHNLFYQTGETGGSSQVSGDPKYKSVSSGDFRLQSGSPAINKGYDMGLPKVGQPDIGLDEYGYSAPKQDSGVTPPKQDSGSGGSDQGTGQPGSDAGVPAPSEGGVPNASNPSSDPNNPNPQDPYAGPLVGGCQLGQGGGAPASSATLLIALSLLILLRRRP